MTGRRRRGIFGLSIAAGGILLAACTSGPSGCSTSAGGSATDTSRDSSAAGTSAAAPGSAEGTETVPAGLERFYDQSLNWGPCADYGTGIYQRDYYASPLLQCTRFTVPLDYDNVADPSTPVLQLAAVRKSATGPSARIGTAVVTGGGSNYGLDLLAMNLSEQPEAELNKAFDLVAYDQRGMGASAPQIACLSAAELDSARSTDTRTRTAEDIAAANSEAATFAAGCQRLTTPPAGVDVQSYLSHAGTREAARDLDVLRAAVGEDEISIVGISSGTKVARTYAEQFTDKVRVLVLDGVTATGADQAADQHRWSAAVQQAFNDYAIWCAPTIACPLGTEPAQAVAAYQAMTRPLLQAPLMLPDGRTLGFDDAITGTLVALGTQVQWANLSSALVALSKGFGTPLMDLADQAWDRLNGDYWPGVFAGQAVACVDGPRPTAAGPQAEAIAADVAQTAPILDNGDPPVITDDVCQTWPGEPTLPISAPTIADLPPTLVISTAGDTVTPYQNGVDLANSLGATLLTVDGIAHGAYLGNIDCVNTAGTTFLTTLHPPAPETRCPPR